MEVLQLVTQLGNALWSLKAMYDQDVDNAREIEELQSFIRDYDKEIPTLTKRLEDGKGNVMGMAAFKNLEKDVMEATNLLKRWSRDKSFFRMFNSAQRMQQLGKLHSKVMACVQKNLGIASISMLLDLRSSQATILESNAELKSLLITTIGSVRGMLPTQVREEVVEASSASFGDPKFWEDILAAVDSHKAEVSLLEEKNVYEDPVTTNLMIDPVVASDGNTYCRWTIIDNNLTTSPFNADDDFSIFVDNLAFRRGLFEKFPEQFEIFCRRCKEYRSRAFSLKARGLWGDAALALHHVLQWDKRDMECVEALEQIKVAQEEFKEKFLQASEGPSNQVENGCPIGSIASELVVGPTIDLDGAYKLFHELRSSTIEVQHHALFGVSQWSAKNEDFQQYIFDNGGMKLLASLLPASDITIEGYVLSILRSLSDLGSSLKQIRDFPVVMEPLGLVVSEGSTQACEQAVHVLYNLSTHIYETFCWGDRWFGLSFKPTIQPLVTSLIDRHPLIQQMVASTLKKIFFFDSNKMLAIEVGLVSILLKLMVEQPMIMLEEGLPLLDEFLFEYDEYPMHAIVRDAIPPSLWLDLVASASAKHQEWAAALLCRLCLSNKKYHQEAIRGKVIERFSKLVDSSKLKEDISFVLKHNSWKRISMRYSIHDGRVIEKVWWSPKKGGKEEQA